MVPPYNHSPRYKHNCPDTPTAAATAVLAHYPMRMVWTVAMAAAA